MVKKILAIFTLFDPDEKNITKFVQDCLAYPDCDVFLSDNAQISESLRKSLESPRVIYHNNGGNLGLGAAQNKGLTLALEKNYDYAILFDQDSWLSPNFIENFIHEFELARVADPKIIFAGPFFNHAKPKENQYRKTIIASGTLIYLPFLMDVGLIDEGLFIDYVDTDWCYRAREKGYKVIKLAKAHMYRRIGQDKKLWFGIKFNYHAPFRYYYFFRNGIILMKRKRLPWRHIWHFRRHLLKTLFLPQKWERLKYICKGIRDGIRSS